MTRQEIGAWAGKHAMQFVVNTATAVNIVYPPDTVANCTTLFEACKNIM